MPLFRMLLMWLREGERASNVALLAVTNSVGHDLLFVVRHSPRTNPELTERRCDGDKLAMHIGED